MPVLINLPKYYSQHDSDAGGYKGACVETCLKMITHALTGREVSIKSIVDHGDGDPSFTTVAGAQKEANFLNIPLEGHIYTPEIIRNTLSKGYYIIATIQYSRVPSNLKQDLGYGGSHAVVITGIADDNAIRYADPNFFPPRRDEGFLNNNKWTSWAIFSNAWNVQNYFGFTIPKKQEDDMATNAELEKQVKELQGWLKDTGNVARDGLKQMKFPNYGSLNDTDAVKILKDKGLEYYKSANSTYVPVGELFVRK